MQDESEPHPRRGAGAGALAADLALVALSLAVRRLAPLSPCDDAFIVLAAARSALAGNGFHLLPGGGDAVLTTLAWPALAAPLLALGLAPAAALALLGGGAEIALALVVRRLAQRLTGSLAAGATVAALLVTHPVLRLASQGGMETPLFLALGAGAALALAARVPMALALAGGLLPWVRFDGFLPAAIFLGFGFRTWRGEADRIARRWLAAGALLAALVPLGHRLLQGAWLPATIGAKALHGGEASLAGAEAVALEFARATAGMSSYWLISPSVHLLLVPLALWGIHRRGRELATSAASAATLLWSFFHAAAFVLAGRAYATNFPWYFVPPLLGLGLLAAYGLASLDALRVPRAPRAAAALPALLVLAVGLAALPSLRSGFGRVQANFSAHRERAYAAAAIWLGRHGPAESVASNEIGTLAWYSPAGTEIVDLFGLARRPAERGLGWLELVRRRRPEAVVTRVDFRYRRELEAALPGAYLWARLGAMDVGLRADRAARFAPFQEELPRLYLGLEPGAVPPLP